MFFRQGETVRKLNAANESAEIKYALVNIILAITYFLRTIVKFSDSPGALESLPWKNISLAKCPAPSDKHNVCNISEITLFTIIISAKGMQ